MIIMMYHALVDITQSIDVAILPIIILPVTGLCCLIFYNRLAAINNVIHNIHRDAINLHSSQSPHTPEQKNEHLEVLSLQSKKLIIRSNMVRTAIVCCLRGLIAFILSAISIIMGLFIPILVFVTIILWVIGAVLVAIGIIIGSLEIKSRSLEVITMESELMEKWRL